MNALYLALPLLYLMVIPSFPAESTDSSTTAPGGVNPRGSPSVTRE
jgi:hypothetical protein